MINQTFLFKLSVVVGAGLEGDLVVVTVVDRGCPCPTLYRVIQKYRQNSKVEYTLWTSFVS